MFLGTHAPTLLREYVLPNGSSRLAGYVKEGSSMGEAVNITSSLVCFFVLWSMCKCVCVCVSVYVCFRFRVRMLLRQRGLDYGRSGDHDYPCTSMIFHTFTLSEPPTCQPYYSPSRTLLLSRILIVSLSLVLGPNAEAQQRANQCA
jgi:hypothetical protein